MAARPAQRRQPAAQILVAAGLALVAVAGLGAAAVATYANATGLADHTVQVRHEVDVWIQLLVDAETGARGYLASNERSLLEPYNVARARERAHAAQVRALVATEDAALDDVEVADGDARATMAHIDQLVVLVDQRRRSEAIAVLASGQGKRLMDAFRRDLAVISADEARLLANYLAKAATSSRRALAGSLLLVLVSCALVGLAWQRERAHTVSLGALADESRRRLGSLSELAAALAEARTRAQVARVVVDHGMRAAGSDTCTLYQIDQAGTGLDLIADRGVAPEVLDKIRRITETEGNPEALKRMKAGEPQWSETEADYARLYAALLT